MHGALSLLVPIVCFACTTVPVTGTGGGDSGSTTAVTGGTSTSTSSMSGSASSSGMDCTVTGCPAGANATGECKNGTCEYTCTPPFGDCDTVPSDCEADLTKNDNCGACSVHCAKSCAPFGDTAGCTEVVEIAAGDSHTCARTGTGVVWCWGSNSRGQLGIGGGAASASAPAKVTLPFVASRLSARGNATCAVGLAGELACWGNDGSPNTTPLVYSGLPKLARVSVGGEKNPDPGLDTFGKTLVLLPSGEVRSFTLTNLANVSLGGVKAAQAGIAAGGLHACIFDPSHSVFCLGDDTRGQLGQGTPGNGPALVVVGAADAVDLVAGYQHTCALDQVGHMSCWGDNQFNQVSGSSVGIFASPQQVSVSLIDAMGAGGRHTAALKRGKLYVWGDNASKQTSPSASSVVPDPTEYTGLGADVVAVALGGAHTCALLVGGVLKCWGDNASGQVAGMPSAPIASPVTISIP